MLPLQLLGPPLTNLMAVGSQVPAIRTPAVRVKAANAEGCKPSFEFLESLILAATEDIREDPPRLMFQRSPQPPRVLLAADTGSHLVQLRFLYSADHHRGW
jgi:hypothetical protein